MADRRKRVSDDIVARAAIEAGKDAARRAVDGLLTSDEDRAQEEAERTAASKKKRTKLVVLAVIGLLLVVGLVGMVLSYWQWFLLAGIAGAFGIYGWYRFKKRLGTRRRGTEKALGPKPRTEALEEAAPEEPVVRARGPAVDVRAREETRAATEKEIEDELAAMKARLGK